MGRICRFVTELCRQKRGRTGAAVPLGHVATTLERQRKMILTKQHCYDIERSIGRRKSQQREQRETTV